VSPLLIQLATLCRDQPTRAKWLFVPSHGQGHTIAERLARTGTAWANLRVTTPLDVALATAAPSLVARDIDPAPESLGPALAGNPTIVRYAIGLDIFCFANLRWNHPTVTAGCDPSA
jgi:hypothetical protein